jgi:hypothetical protein
MNVFKRKIPLFPPFIKGEAIDACFARKLQGTASSVEYISWTQAYFSPLWQRGAGGDFVLSFPG